jgi:signal transduction histidine kinase/class 3 adenylate cyclase/two-component SAPR family response regulator
MRVQPNSKPKLLVVDDEPDNLDLLYRTFHRDFKVLRAESGPSALEILAREGDVAVIISDQRMPLMSGTEFLSLTATQYPDIIRIILTGYTDVEDLVEAINSGKVFKYVTKPWDDEELKAVVRQAVDTHNVLKARTRELRRSLRQESLLNAITSAFRGAVSYRQILQTIGETIVPMFEVNACVVRPCRNGRLEDEWFVYVNDADPGGAQPGETLKTLLGQTVWPTHEPQVIQNVDTDERLQADTPEAQSRQAAYAAAQIRSSLLIPLICQQELMVVLALHQWTQPRLWQDDEVQLLTMVADQAALALSQARSYEQIRDLAKREALINTITTAIRSSLDPQEIFAAITQQLGQALHVDGCALSLWSPEDEFVQCVGLYDPARLGNAPTTMGDPLSEPTIEPGLGDPLPAQPLPQSLVPILGNPVLRQLLLTQQPVVLNDLEKHPEMAIPDQPFRARARALFVVPLLSDGKIIGSISLRQNQQPRRWRLTEIELAQAVAAQAAIAVQQSRLYQKTRQQAEQLLALDRQKTEFFQNISHEFRTPLTLTIGPLESAVAQRQGIPFEQAEITLRNSRRLLRLVNQLLDLQRLDAGRMQPSFRPCNLAKFVSQTVDAFRPYCDKKGVSLITHLSLCAGLYLDLERFDKVLYNLLSNAMKFTPSSGSITITLQPAGDHCLLKVSDTGIGIRPDQIPHLFERFRQAEGSANRSYEGSGLGLSLVKELVELHGGQVTVDSAYGAGTTFTVWLQTGSAHLPPHQVIDVQTEVLPSRALVELSDIEMELGEDEPIEGNLNAAPSSDRAAQVLIVDDNSDLRTYVSRILREQGYQVWLARNGSEGFKVAQARRPNLIITDLMMPMVSGLDLIRMVREDADLKGTPIVLLTAKADEDTRIDGVEKGADAYLSKPFSDRELLAEVHNLLALKANERRVAELNTYLTDSVLRRFLPPSLVQRAAQGELVLDLRPEPRMVTVLFSDIVGFTQLSNTLRSRRVAELLNEYLHEMTRVVFDNGGTVDKFMGDAILALFGAPEELSPNEQVRRAVAAGRQMQQALNQLNDRWQEHGISPVQFRCGIHQGTAVVGMFGGAERADYTAIGPSVNIASRLQEAAEPGSILVSAVVADYLGDHEVIKFVPLKLKGVDETVLTFALTNPSAQQLRPSA